MGYGGDLIWTGVFKALHEQDGAPAYIVHKPKFTDLLAGRLFDASAHPAEAPVFYNNPRIRSKAASPRPGLLKIIYLAFSACLKPWSLKTAYERAIFRRSQDHFRKTGERLVHTDMVIHSYAKKQLKDRFLWKDEAHAIQSIAKSFLDQNVEPTCELYFDAEEEQHVASLLSEKGLTTPFIALDSGTNKDWFGALRSWPEDRWRDLAARLRKAFPETPIVQLGVPETPLLDGVVDLRGQTSFREAALVMRQAALFIGTESGPMHAARSVGVPSVIIWGGVTLPEFAGYPDVHEILCSYVDCAPCGRLGACPNDHVCMTSISVEDVFVAVQKCMETD